MYIRKKGKYYQVVESKGRKQVVVEHLGPVEKIVEAVRFWKEQKKLIGTLNQENRGFED